MKRVLSNKWHIMVFVLPTVLFFTFFVMIPIAMSAFYSTLNWTTKTKPTFEYFVGFRNYIDMFTAKGSSFPDAVWHSLLYAGASVFLQLPFSLLLALLLARGVKAESFYRNVYFIPVILSSVVVGQLWRKIYNNDYGLLNLFLRSIGAQTLKGGWLANKGTRLWATFVPVLWQYVGYHMLLMYGALKSISPDIIEAATVDGASGPTMALRIQIPLIRPMLKVCLSFSLIGSFKLYDMVKILTDGNIGTEVPATTMYREMFKSHNFGTGSAMAMFIVAECLLFTVLLNIIFRDRDALAERSR
ncbi:MAG: sugar ABC transporter permease [Clostridia bacterium]|nr:sugar ABC transporter permease [Clostridia bacterium]